MGSEAIKNWNAKDRRDYLRWDPKDITIVEEDESSPLYDPDSAKAVVPEWLIRSVMKRGVLQPIRVRLNGTTKGGKPIVEVIDGRTRVRAAREANRRLVAAGGEAILVSGIQTKAAEADLAEMVVEMNEARREILPLERARKAQRLHMVYEKTKKEIAETFGVTVQTVSSWLDLMTCTKKVQESVERGEVPASVASKLVALPAKEQWPALEKMIADGATKGASARAAVERATGRARGKPEQEDAPAKRLPTRKELEALRDQMREQGSTGGAMCLLGLVLDGDPGPDGWEVGKAWKAVLAKKAAKKDAKKPDDRAA